MNCDESRRHWELYYDSEGDSELYLEINEHLAECPSCAKWFFQRGRVEELITTKLSAREPTADVWHRVLSKAGLARPVTARGWMFFNPLMAIAASLLLLFGGWWLTSDREPEHLAAMTAVVHRGFTEQHTPVDFSSVSDREIEQYLKTRVSFPVRCPPRKDAGFVVRGGGVCTLGGGAAAYVIGNVDGRDVSVFILPEERLAHFGHERNILGRVAVHHCREGAYEMVMAKIDRNVVVVIGQGSSEELERVVRAYGTYPEAPVADAA